MTVRVLDGALGTLLEQRGHVLRAPAWSAAAVRDAPEAIHAIHQAYAQAGATVHTAATFRTTPVGVGDDASRLTRRAVALARDAVSPDHTVLGSLAPVMDCWRPDLCPPDAAARHTAQAEVLWAAGVDGILVETFAHIPEAVAATTAARSGGSGPVWTALTPGFRADLLTPEGLARGARAVLDAGADLVLVNCLPAERATPWVRALAALGAPFGVYANGGLPGSPCAHDTPGAPARYAALARSWRDAGAVVVGGCCGTGPCHTRHLVECL